MTAVLELIGAVLETFEGGGSVVLTFADLTKLSIVFPMINYWANNRVMMSVGLQIFKSFLTNRNQAFSVKGTKFQPLSVNYGVCEGSVIGPAHFLVTVNYLDQLDDLLLFADDKLFLRAKALPKRQYYKPCIASFLSIKDG